MKKKKEELTYACIFEGRLANCKMLKQGIFWSKVIIPCNYRDDNGNVLYIYNLVVTKLNKNIFLTEIK